MTTSPLTVNFFLHGNCSTHLEISLLDSRNHFFGPIPIKTVFGYACHFLQQLSPVFHPSHQIHMKNNFFLLML